jgi:hypothetical protein
MKKAHLYEALYLVNHGIDEAVSGVMRLKKAPHAFREVYHKSMAGLERRRALINGQFMHEMAGREEDDAFFFEEEYNRWLSDDPLDNEEIYKLVRFIERQRKQAGEPPLVQFLKPKKKDKNADKGAERNANDGTAKKMENDALLQQVLKDTTPKPNSRVPKPKDRSKVHESRRDKDDIAA